MRVLGVILVLAGMAMFLIGGISFTRDRTVAEFGPVELRAEEEDVFPLAPYPAAIATLLGLSLLVLSTRRSR